MEIISENPSYWQFSFDATESDGEVRDFEDLWGTSTFSRIGEAQLNSTRMLEIVGCHGTNIQALSCQPYGQRNLKGTSKMPTNYDVKIEEGCLFDEGLSPSNASPILINQTPQFDTGQMYLGNNTTISRSSNQLMQNNFATHSYGGGELSYLHGETVSQECHMLQPHAKSSVNSVSFTLDGNESSASNELVCSSEMQLTDALFDQSKLMEYQLRGLEPMFEDPFANMPVIQSFTNDGCSFDQNIKPAMGEERRKTFTQVDEGRKAAPSQRLSGYSEWWHQGNNRALPLKEANKDLKDSRIDFEESLVHSHILTKPESKILTGDSSVTSGGTRVCHTKPIPGLFSRVDYDKYKSCVVNNDFNAGPPFHTCALGNELLDRYTCRKRKLNDMQETSIVQPCCSFASESSAALECGTSKDIVDGCHSKMSDFCPMMKKLCRESNGRRMKNDGMETGLIHLLTAGAEAMARRDTSLASVILARLKEMASCSNSTVQRVLAYLVQPLEHPSMTEEGGDHSEGKNARSQGDQLAAFQILHEIFPYIKFGHFTANQAILEAVHDSSRVHIVDFEILEGIQWPAFMQALVARNEAPPALHITAVYGPKGEHGSAMVHKTCKRLKEFASSICLPFSYGVLEIDDDGKGSAIETLQGETLIVNCMVHLPHMPRNNPARITSFLQAMQRFSPAIVTLVEEELGCSTTSAASYLSEALYHFHAICDSLEACLPRQVEARMLVERVFAESSIKSTISIWNQSLSSLSCASYAVDVGDKYKCSTIMYASGLKPIPLSFHNQSQARLLLGLHKDGFELEERGHHLVLGWHGKPLYAASVWN